MDNQDIQTYFLENVSMFQKICDRIKFADISRSEFAMMHMIHCKQNEAASLTLSDLAGFLEISSPAVSRMIKTLEDKGYVFRRVSEKDRRISFVSLTEKGEEVHGECAEKMQQWGEQTMNAMGRENIIQLLSLLSLFFQTFEEVLDSDGKTAISVILQKRQQGNMPRGGKSSNGETTTESR